MFVNVYNMQNQNNNAFLSYHSCTDIVQSIQIDRVSMHIPTGSMSCYIEADIWISDL